MRFLILLWNIIMSAIHMIIFIAMEIFIFSIVYGALKEAEMPIIANILAVIFTIWIIVDVILTIFVRSGKTLIRYILNI